VPEGGSFARTEQDALAERVRAILPHGAIREVTMFGGLSFMMDDRLVVAARRNGDLLIHIDPASYGEFLERGAAPAFMGKDRPMGRGWVTVPAANIASANALEVWVRAGLTGTAASAE
jgi:hypothetical protein